MTSEETIREYVARPYSRILVPDSSGRYFAEILEFPGCFSEGDTPGQAMDNLNEAMAAWIEAALDSGQAIPDPIATAGYSGRVLLRLPKSLHREAARRAEMDGVSLNQYLVAAVAARAGADDLANRIAARLAGVSGTVTLRMAEMNIAIDTAQAPITSLKDSQLLGEADASRYLRVQLQDLMQEKEVQNA